MCMPIIDRAALRTALLTLASAIVLGACALQPKPVPELELPSVSEPVPAALDLSVSVTCPAPRLVVAGAVSVGWA